MGTDSFHRWMSETPPDYEDDPEVEADLLNWQYDWDNLMAHGEPVDEAEKQSSHTHYLRRIKEKPWRYKCITCGQKLKIANGIIEKAAPETAEPVDQRDSFVKQPHTEEVD